MLKNSLLLPAWLGIVLAGMGAAAPGSHPDKAGRLDVSAAVIVTPPHLGAAEQKAVTVLREEIQKRTGIRLEQAAAWPKSPTPVIAVGLQSQAEQFAGPLAAELRKTPAPGPEGFALTVARQPRPAILIAGSDSRGLLYGIGRLLRAMELKPQTATVPAGLRIATAPKYPLRGHQLGYRPKVNAYDAWSEAQFDQYIRELALFGANSIEILPPRTDDQRTSRHMKLPPLEMMERLSEIIDSYGLDVWIWYPNMGKDYGDEADGPRRAGRAARRSSGGSSGSIMFSFPAAIRATCRWKPCSPGSIASPPCCTSITPAQDLGLAPRVPGFGPPLAGRFTAT